MRTTALLLAAGESARMGTPKALLEWGGRPLLGHQLAVLQRSRVDECIVVLGREAGRLGGLVQPLLRPRWKARAVVNPRPADGRSSSVKAGLAALSRPPAAILIACVDQPLERDLVDALLEAGEKEWGTPSDGGPPKRIVIPTFGGHRGHPPLFHGSLFPELLGVSEETEGLRRVVRRIPERVLEVPWQRSGVLLNLNNPSDYESTRGPDSTFRSA
jgi:molybdenum cofactor cytidylyltransferase